MGENPASGGDVIATILGEANRIAAHAAAIEEIRTLHTRHSGMSGEVVAQAHIGAGSPRTGIHRGAIIGVVDLVDVHPDAGCCRPWGESAYIEHGGRVRRSIVHLVLESPRELAEPIPCRGALGLWTPPADVIERLQAVTA